MLVPLSDVYRRSEALLSGTLRRMRRAGVLDLFLWPVFTRKHLDVEAEPLAPEALGVGVSFRTVDAR